MTSDLSDRDFIRQAGIAAALQTDATRIQCPHCPECHYAVTSKDRAKGEARMAEHLATDARHTGSAWIDRNGNERIGLAQR
jgi:hypothetical protein